jgi:hypothetical protein
VCNYLTWPTILNCIFWNDSGSSSEPEIYNFSIPSSTKVSYSVVQGGYPGAGNLDANPLLNTDMTLQTGSPAIDSGSCESPATTTDILGNARWDISSVTNASGGNGVDIGAYEYQGNARMDAVISTLACDRP